MLPTMLDLSSLRADHANGATPLQVI